MSQESSNYFPCLTTRESECRALLNLAEPTKDLLFPIVRLQAWPRAKAGAGTPIERSITSLAECFGSRRVGVDLAMPRADLGSAWAAQGRAEVQSLRDEQNGFESWRSLVAANPSFIPAVQWSQNPTQLRYQVEELAALGRGIIFRFRKTQNWNIAELASLHEIDLEPLDPILIFDVDQIDLKEDLTVLGLSVQGAMLAVRQMISGSGATFVLSGSSFPSSFADIHPTYAELPIRERQLFEMLRLSPPMIQAGIQLRYGDHASVFAADREPAFRGAPRVDYPSNSRWVYYRNSAGFAGAVQSLRHGPAWDDNLLCWGAQRIRTAANGDLTGLGAQGPWVTIRLNIHMHLQAHFADGGITPVEEEWVD